MKRQGPFQEGTCGGEVDCSKHKMQMAQLWWYPELRMLTSSASPAVEDSYEQHASSQKQPLNSEITS
jgi:hypothetical protein